MVCSRDVIRLLKNKSNKGKKQRSKWNEMSVLILKFNSKENDASVQFWCYEFAVKTLKIKWKPVTPSF